MLNEKIAALLQRGPRTASQLAELTGRTVADVREHLDAAREAGEVTWCPVIEEPVVRWRLA